MKKNKRSRRVFSRVLDRLTWANVYRVRCANESAYKAVLAAKRWLEDCGFEDVKVAFYDHEYHIQFTAYPYWIGLNRYYTVSATHGYVNDYHRSNRYEIRNIIGMREFARDCTLSRDFHDYQLFQQYADSILFWALTHDEYVDYAHNGNLNDIPFDTAVRLWRELRECMERIVDEAVAYKGVQI